MQNQKKLYAKYRKWRSENLGRGKGIVVGCDISQQWLLPWWWSHYKRFNSFEVAFVDFGMSEEMKKWCRERGELIALPIADIFVAAKEEIDPALVQEMENATGKDFWSHRSAWFKKPLACLQSPFRCCIWIDLDCQIRGSLNFLFSLCKTGIAMAREQFGPNDDKTIYNAGVIVFGQSEPLIEDWADASFECNHQYRGDQDILNALIQEKNSHVTEIPQTYNWSRLREENPDAIILHWHGPHGKSQIVHQIARANLKESGLVTQ